MSKKLFAALLLISLLFTLVSCVKPPDTDDEEKTMKYSDIYKYAPVSYTHLTLPTNCT